MATLATINIKATLDSMGISRGISSAQRALSGFASFFQTRIAALFGAAGLASFAGWGARLAMEAETAQVSFGVLLDSGEKANAMLKELKAFANSTPLTFGGLQESAKLLLQFGVAGENVVPVLRMLGDISGGSTERMHALALAFGQVTAAGRLQGQDLLQMVNAGFNPLLEISKRTGESMLDLRKRMEAGAIGANEVTQSFIDATSEGGRFNGMLEQLGPKMVGQWNQLKGLFEEFARQTGEALGPLISGLFEVGKHFMEILIPVSRAFLDTVVAMIMPISEMPSIWEGVSFAIETAGYIATNLFSIMIGGWKVVTALTQAYWTVFQMGIALIEREWQRFWGENTTMIDKEINRLAKHFEFQQKLAEGGGKDIYRGITGEAGQEFVDRLNKLKDAARNSSTDVSRGITMAATAAADTLKVAFKDISPGALERGGTAAASAIMKAQREAQGNATERAMLAQLKAIARNTGGPGLAPANI